eukprot:1922954-Heterocapsa_arctica.AAC.1
MVLPLGAHASERSWNSRCCAGEWPCKLGGRLGSVPGRTRHICYAPPPLFGALTFYRLMAAPRAPA